MKNKKIYSWKKISRCQYQNKKALVTDSIFSEALESAELSWFQFVLKKEEENRRRPQGRNENFQQHLALSAAAKVPVIKSQGELYDMTYHTFGLVLEL